jgi:hypothetical protein
VKIQQASGIIVITVKLSSSLGVRRFGTNFLIPKWYNLLKLVYKLEDLLFQNVIGLWNYMYRFFS